VLFFWIGINACSAQQFYFKNYNADNGMPFVQVYAMFQDSKGFLYTGGYGGLSRFDGKEFMNITTKHGLADNYVNAINENYQGNMLVGTKKGLNIISNNKVLKEVVLKDKNILSIEPANDSLVFIGTESGLFVYNNKSVTELSAYQGFQIRDILFNTKKLFVATNKGLIMGDLNSYELITNGPGLLPSVNINCLSLSPDSKTLAVGSAGGLSLINLEDKKIVNLAVQNGLLDNNVSCLYYGSKGGLWIGSHVGLIKYDNYEFTYYSIYYDNNSNLIRTLLKDYEGNLWIGTHSGMYRYRDNSFSTFDHISGPGNAFIFEIFKAGSDLYLCSENNGIYRYSQGYFKRFGVKDGLPSNVCRSGTVSKDGRVFIDSEGDVFEFKNDKFYQFTLPKQSVGPHYKMYCDENNKLWIGGTKGVAVVSLTDKKDSVFYKLPQKSTDFQVTDICRDEQGNTWIAAYMSGLYRISNGIIVNYGEKLKLNQLDVVTARYHDGYLFAGTLSGLLVINTKNDSYQLIKQEDGLISDIIYAIGFAKEHKVLWVGTNLGLSELDVKKLRDSSKVSINNYGKNEGFTGIESNTNGIFEDESDIVWFGTVNGLVKYIPDRYKRNQFKNKIHIYKFRLGETDTLLANQVQLPYNYNNITFYYRGLCFTNPDKVKYKVKLAGYDKAFTSPGFDNFSKYTNLEPGTYTFQVLSCNNEGLWDDEPLNYVFTLQTPYFKTWWFTLIVIVLSIVIVYSSFKLRLNHLKLKQQKDFERKVEISKVELKALRAQMNPHFVFNSLNSIQHYIFNNKSDDAVKYLNKFAKLMRVILSNSDKPTVAIEDDLEALKLYLELEQMRFEDKFEYTIEVDKNVDLDYDIMPPMLLQPYVENAILHGLTPRKEKGKLVIELKSQGNYIVCTITDNGIGRKKAFEIKRTMPGSKHKSFGMKITEERLRILNDISLSKHSVQITDLYNNDGNAAGTKVELYVPII